MTINNITCCGFDLLHYAYLQCHILKTPAPGSGFHDLMKKVSITIDLKDLSAMEAFYLKKFATRVFVYDKTVENFIDKKESIDIYQKIENLLEVSNTIRNDEDISKESCPYSFLPIGCDRYSAIAIFEGPGITAITGGMIQEIFYDEKKTLTEFYEGNLLIQEKLVKKFYVMFYQYMSKHMKDIDIVSDFVVRNKFYTHSTELCALAKLHSIHGELTWFGNDATGLQAQVNDYSAQVKRMPYDLEESTYLTFVLRTTMDTFMRFWIYSDYVSDHENLKLTFTQRDLNIADDIGMKYKERILNPIMYLNDYCVGLNNSDKIDLNKFNFIMHGNYISYSVQIPMSKYGWSKSFAFLHATAESESVFKIIDQQFNQIKKFIQGIR